MKTPAEVPHAEPLGSALEFLQHLWRLNHAIERLSIHMERTLGITAQQRLVIRCIGKHRGMTAGQLASVLHLDPGTVSTTLRRLEHKRLVARSRDPRDRRRIRLVLTPSGQTLNRPTAGTVEHAVERLLDAASSFEISATTTLVSKLIQFLGAETA